MDPNYRVIPRRDCITATHLFHHDGDVCSCRRCRFSCAPQCLRGCVCRRVPSWPPRPHTRCWRTTGRVPPAPCWFCWSSSWQTPWNIRCYTAPSVCTSHLAKEIYKRCLAINMCMYYKKLIKYMVKTVRKRVINQRESHSGYSYGFHVKNIHLKGTQ